eukprot:TRINITY_DN1767_c0_g1_i1.p1 TRINITY_DN1767_c0_g1~~TRINITY_DN1767_c0_g1_i1.p1  ORF type:complete len:1062 (+),score=326.54 TRINITY_DN1767_c0_g1_i1:52-3186(+)
MATAGMDSSGHRATTPFIKAAACLAEAASEGFSADSVKDLDWDPLNLGDKPASSDASRGSMMTIPSELMQLVCKPQGVPPRTAPPPAAAAAPNFGSSIKERALRKLQQRREAARAAAEQAALEKEANAASSQQARQETLDEAWIDEADRATAAKKEEEAKKEEARKQKLKKAKEAKKTKAAAAAVPEKTPSGAVKQEALVQPRHTKPDIKEPESEPAEAASVAADSNSVTTEPPELASAEPTVPLEEVEKLLMRLKDQSRAPAGGSVDRERIFTEALDGLAAIVSGQGACEYGSNDIEADDDEDEDDDASVEMQTGCLQKVKRKRRKEKKGTEKHSADPTSAQDTERRQKRGEKEPASAKMREEQAKREQEEARQAQREQEQRRQEQHRQQEESRRQQELSRKRQQEEVAEKQRAEKQVAEEAQKDENARRPWRGWAKAASSPSAATSAALTQDFPSLGAASKQDFPSLGQSLSTSSSSDSKARPQETEASTPAAGETLPETPSQASQAGEPEVHSPAKDAEDSPSAEPAQAATPGGSKALAADAPDFVPMSMLQTPKASSSSANRGSGKKDKKGRDTAALLAESGADPNIMSDSVAVTTMMITGISPGHSSDSFRQQMDGWGLMGTYNFFYMPEADADAQLSRYAIVNFIDATFAQLCQWLFHMYQFDGSASPSPVQGLENNITYWYQFVDDDAEEPLVIPTPTPSLWAVNGVNMILNSKFSPQIKGQFHKTKMCGFYKKGQCAMGVGCPFAHYKDELMPAPDLAKTKLCYNFFRRKCNDKKCKFAHGYPELRATNNVYKTELCRWYSFGSCKAGSSCRYAHGIEELRRSMPGMSDFDFASLGGEFSMYGMSPFGADGTADAEQPGGMPEKSSGSADSGMRGGRQMSQMSDAKEAQHEQSGVRGSRQVSIRSDAKEQMIRQLSGTTDLNSDVHSSGDVGAVDALGRDLGHAKGAQLNLKRQMTAPVSSLASGAFVSGMPPSSGDVVLRVKGTFMEAVTLDAELALKPIHRSWSDGDLAQLSEVMESSDCLLDAPMMRACALAY